jgi:subtilisin-like proprotein convertase family protein
MKPSTTRGVLEINQGRIVQAGRGTGLGQVVQNRTPWVAVLCAWISMTPQAVIADPMAEASENVAGSCPGPDSDGDGVGDACDNCSDNPAETLTFAQTVNAPIPDPASLTTCGTVTASLSRTITVNDPGTTSGLRVSVNLLHPVYSDVDIKLAHAGTVITLNPVSSTSQSRNTSDLNGTYRFDDAAGVPLEYAANNCFIFECGVVPPGTYHGSALLGALAGTPANGDWTLIVSDGCRINTGTLRSWSLELDIAYPNQFDFDHDGVGDVCDNCPSLPNGPNPIDQVSPQTQPGPEDDVPHQAFLASRDGELTQIDVARLGGGIAGRPRRFLLFEGGVGFPEAPIYEQEYDIAVVAPGGWSPIVLSPPVPVFAGQTYTWYIDDFITLMRGNYPVPGLDSNQGPNLDYAFRTYLSLSSPSQSDVDGDGIGDACDWCAGGPGSGDIEADGDFDRWDYQRMSECLQGVNEPPLHDCECFDFDADGDVDLKDARYLALDFQPETGCRINGVFYEPGQTDVPPFACRSCQPRVSRTLWTMSPADTVCRPAAGGCDIADVCSGTSTSCPQDLIRPSQFICRPAGGGCDVAETCNGASAFCPQDLIRPNNYACRPSAGICDLAEWCDGFSAVCPQDAKQLSSVVCAPSTGPNGEYLCRDTVRCNGTSSTCPLPTIISYDADRICRPSTAQCDPPEYCVSGGVCAPDVSWTTGQVCPGAGACEFDYTCDSAGRCNPQPTRYRSGTASCRAPANGCDQRDYCGSCDAGGNCGGPFNDERTRTDFTDYPGCGPDVKKPNSTACAVGALAGTCFSGECITISNCRYDIDCPDGYLCNGGDCVAPTVDHGFGDECVGKRMCDGSSVTPRAFCAFSSDCRDATHPNGNCVPVVQGDCVGDLFCCAGMAGDGVGAAATPGQKGRCQECCATDYNDVTVTGCGDFQCCNGKCTDTDSDADNCGGCAYNGGVDCDTLVDACTPIVEGCELGECFLQSACYDANDPTSIYDLCTMNGSYSVPDPQCNYCLPSLTPNPALHNTGCYSDADCGGAAGSCHIVNGRCSPDSARPYEECDPQSPVGDSQCWLSPNLSGTCVGSCQYPVLGPNGFYFAHYYDINIDTDACETPPFSACTVTCRRDMELCQDDTDPDDILPANYGDECTSDADCHCGLTCQSSCEYSPGGNPIYFCFSPDTCQSP